MINKHICLLHKENFPQDCVCLVLKQLILDIYTGCVQEITVLLGVLCLIYPRDPAVQVCWKFWIVLKLEMTCLVHKALNKNAKPLGIIVVVIINDIII